MWRAALAVLVSVSFFSCRTPPSAEETSGTQQPPPTAAETPRPVESAAPPSAQAKPPEPPGDPKDNRSALGGLKGSSDTNDIPANLPRFKISGDYPRSPDFLTPPPPVPDIQAMQSKDAAVAQAAAKKWLTAMQAYLYQDMNDQNSSDPNRNFRVGGGKTQVSARRWYHMPWLHTPNFSVANPGRGRDAIWGLTRELDLLGPIPAGTWPVNTGKTPMGSDWGIGFFNEPGGYAIGQVFPAGDQVKPALARFPKGTVSFKVLFTTATPEQLSDIDGAWVVDANVSNLQGGRSTESRAIAKVRHVQMDVMMRYGDGPDEWIFGAFVYNKNRRAQFWNGMEPIGVQFGPRLAQTVKVSDVTPNGLQGRLNGPADNPMSSCLSCHARAQWPETGMSGQNARLPFAPANASDTKNICLLHDWGGEGTAGCPPCRDGACIKPGTAPLIPGHESLDYSLQFSLALRNRQNAQNP